MKNMTGVTVSSPGTNQGPRATSSALCNVHPHLPHHSDWELGHRHVDSPGLSSPHARVLFPHNLSLVDVCYPSAVTPTVPAGFIPGDKVISYDTRAAQMFFYAAFATVESYLLASMAYDRYAAVCKPLHCTTITTRSVCAVLLQAPMSGYRLLEPVDSGAYWRLWRHLLETPTGDTFSLSFCMFSVARHFFCDVPAVMVLSRSDRHVSEPVLVYVVSINVFFALLVTLISYIFMFITILKMPSSAGHQKALSTCASHFTAVSIYCGTIIFMYSQPSSSHSMDTDKTASVFYAMIIPLLNPVVYSLRNREVKSAFMKLVVEAKLSLGL